MASHLLRSCLGQFSRGLNSRRAISRGRSSGHPRQKKFPASSSVRTSNPRKCTHPNVVARFLGARVGSHEPVEDHGNRDKEHGNLKHCAGMAPLQESADDRNSQQVKSLGCVRHSERTLLTSNSRVTARPSARVIRTVITQSPLILKSREPRYCPDSVSCASPSTGGIPGCVIFPSSATFAPLTGAPVLSVRVRVTVAGPTFGGSGRDSDVRGSDLCLFR